MGLWERSSSWAAESSWWILAFQVLDLEDEPIPFLPLQQLLGYVAPQELVGYVVLPHSPLTQARLRIPTGHSLVGHSPSPAALSAVEGLISYAVQQGHLSPLYIQPLLVKGENCLAPLQTASPKKGKTFNLTGYSSGLLLQSLPNATGSDVFSQVLTGFLLIGNWSPNSLKL